MSDILYTIQYIQLCKPFLVKETRIFSHEDVISDKDEALTILENNMRSIMDELDTSHVVDYTIKKIGAKLILPVKRVRAKKAKPEIEPKVDYIAIAKKSKPAESNVWGCHIINTDAGISDKLHDILAGKRILFIENDSSLDYSVGKFYRWTLAHGIDSYALFKVKELPLEFTASKIIEYDVIVYMSQYVYESTHQLIEFVKSLPASKTIIECYISEPKWYGIPKGAEHHNIYTLDSYSDDVSEWEIDKVEKK